MAIIIFENALPVKEIMEEAKALIRAKTAQDFSQAIGVVPSRAGRLLRGNSLICVSLVWVRSYREPLSIMP